MSQRERERQQVLMASLLDGQSGLHALRGWVAEMPAGSQRGLQAYQANAGASAERALAGTYPTVQALVGEESFAALARAYWHAHPPLRGDLAHFGEGLPAFIAHSEQLADVPYLADSARLDGLLAEAERAGDEVADLETLNLLAENDPSQLRLQLMAGVSVISSAYPVVSVWRAHQSADDAEAHRKQARAAIAAGFGENAIVWRQGWRATAQAISPAAARWMQALLRHDTLALALSAAGEDFVFEAWLGDALRHGWLARAAIV